MVFLTVHTSIGAVFDGAAISSVCVSAVCSLLDLFMLMVWTLQIVRNNLLPGSLLL